MEKGKRTYSQEEIEMLKSRIASTESQIKEAAKYIAQTTELKSIVFFASEITRLESDRIELIDDLQAHEKGLSCQTFLEKADRQLTPEQEAERAEILAEQELVQKGERFYAECVQNGWYEN